MSSPGQNVVLTRRRLQPAGRQCSAALQRAPIVAAQWLTSLPARVLLVLIWLYRQTLSPVLPVVLGPGCGCRFHPTCAVFAAESVREHGAVRGSWLALRRLLKCHPLNPGGFDPVPPSAGRRPTCRAIRGPGASPLTPQPNCRRAPARVRQLSHLG